MSTASEVPETRDLELEGDDAIETLRSIGRIALLQRAAIRFRYADGFSHSRALGFQLMLTLLPGLIAVVGLAAVLGQGSFSDVLADTIDRVAPGPAGEIFTQAFQQGSQNGHNNALALVLGAIASIVAGAGAMGQIERGANRIYGVERDRPAVAKYTVATGLALTAGLATVGAFVLVVFGASLGDAIGDVKGWSDVAETAWAIGRWPIGAALIAGAVALVFEISPRRHQPEPSWLAFGSVVSVPVSYTHLTLPTILRV